MTFLLTFFSETFSIENFCLCQYLLSKLVYFCVKHLKSAPKLKHGLDKKFVLIIITTQSSRSPFVCGTPTSLLNFHSLHMYIYKYISKVKVFSSYTPVSSLSNINHCRQRRSSSQLPQNKEAPLTQYFKMHLVYSTTWETTTAEPQTLSNWPLLLSPMFAFLKCFLLKTSVINNYWLIWPGNFTKAKNFQQIRYNFNYGKIQVRTAEE